MDMEIVEPVGAWTKAEAMLALEQERASFEVLVDTPEKAHGIHASREVQIPGISRA